MKDALGMTPTDLIWMLFLAVLFGMVAGYLIGRFYKGAT